MTTFSLWAGIPMWIKLMIPIVGVVGVAVFITWKMDE